MLAENPRPSGCEKLTGQERYRIRQGRYRIVYSIQDKQLTVWVIKVGHKKCLQMKRTSRWSQSLINQALADFGVTPHLSYSKKSLLFRDKTLMDVAVSRAKKNTL